MEYNISKVTHLLFQTICSPEQKLIIIKLQNTHI